MAVVAINVEIVEGRGSVVASKNGTVIATVNPGDGLVSLSYNTGDTYYFQAYPDTSLGYSFNKFCGDAACTIVATTSGFGGTVSASGYVGAYFKGTSATINVAVQGGGGKVDVYRNTRYVSTVTTSQSINFFVNDSFTFTATPSSGYTFQKFCADTSCGASTTSNPFSGTVTSSGSVIAYFSSCTNCDLNMNYCIIGNCIPKQYVTYGALAFGAMFLLSFLKG